MTCGACGRLHPTCSQLPEEVTKQLGSANLLYATGQFKEAADILMSVIKVGRCDV
jgi:hypothetical protein